MRPVQTTTGIQLTDSALRVAVVQVRFGKFRLLRSDTIEGFAALSPEGKQSAVAALIKQLKLRRIPAFLTVPRQMGICRQIELPVEVGDRVGSAVGLQLESLSPWSADEVYWGYSVNPPAKNDKSIKVAVAIVPRSVLEPILEVFKSAGLPLSGAGLSGMAEAHASVVSGKMTVEEARSFVFGRPADLLDQGNVVSLSIENAGKAATAELGAVVAAILGLGSSAFGVNLIPTAARYRRNPLQLVPTYVLCGLLVLLGVAALFRAPYQWHVYASSLDAEIEALKPEVDAVLAQEEKLGQTTTAYQALQARVGGHDFNLEALLELARVLPPDCWIASYNSQGGSVTLSGFAASASAVQKVLEESPVFEDVEFSSPVTRDAAGKDRFSIKASIGAAQ
jgi:Tfp pilus assembly protein PilN